MMLSRKPMNRTGFKQPERPAKVARLLQPIRQDVSFEPAKLQVQQPKHEYVRSEALMKAYRMLPCQFIGCGIEDGSVAGAHANWGWGKGRGIKADDNRAASLCLTHHTEIDQGTHLTDYEKRQLWFDAHRKTVQKLVILKAWPKDIPVPSLDWPETW